MLFWVDSIGELSLWFYIWKMRKPSDRVYKLIQSLSGREVEGFVRYVQLRKGDKRYYELFNHVVSNGQFDEVELKKDLQNWPSLPHYYKIKSYLEVQLLNWLSSQREQFNEGQNDIKIYFTLIDRNLGTWAKEVLNQFLKKLEGRECFDQFQYYSNKVLINEFGGEGVGDVIGGFSPMKIKVVCGRATRYLNALMESEGLEDQLLGMSGTEIDVYLQSLKVREIRAQSRKEQFVLLVSQSKVYFRIKDYSSCITKLEEIRRLIGDVHYLLDDPVILMRYAGLIRNLIMLNINNDKDIVWGYCIELRGLALRSQVYKNALLKRYYLVFFIFARQHCKGDISEDLSNYEAFVLERKELFSVYEIEEIGWLLGSYYFRVGNFIESKRRFLEVSQNSKDYSSGLYLATQIMLAFIFSEEGDVDFVSHFGRSIRYFKQKESRFWPQAIKIVNELLRLAKSVEANNLKSYAGCFEKLKALLLVAEKDTYSNLLVEDLRFWINRKQPLIN